MGRPSFPPAYLLLLLLFCFSLSSADLLPHFQLGSPSLCSLVDCVNGECVGSSSFPFFECRCNASWASPFNLSYVPCVLPNCTINLGCSNSSGSVAPPPAFSPNSSTDACAFPVCGNGACIPASNSSTGYRCKCDAGYTNLFNTSSGYCLQDCSLGADCNNLKLPLIGSPTGSPTGSNDSSTPSTAGPSSRPVTKTLIVFGAVSLAHHFLL